MDYFTYEIFNVSLMVTTKQKPRIDSQKIQKGGKRTYDHERSPIYKGMQKRKKKKWKYETTGNQLIRWH